VIGEHPMFVPFGEEHLAAVLTVPEGSIRGLAVLLQGLGATRSHRYSLWARTARALAERDIASVRMDYREIGDSTGTASNTLGDPPVGEASTVVEVALRALGLREFGMVGNCLGIATSLHVAATHPGCRFVACVLPGTPAAVLKDEGRTAPHRAARRLSKRAPRLGSFGRAVLRSHRIRPRIRFLPEVLQVMRGADLMLFCLGREDVAGRLRRALDAGNAEVASTGHRAEVRVVPTGNSRGMRLSLSDQPTVIGAIVDWFDEVMPPAKATPREARDLAEITGDA
jgi:hypothetical protein